jgi:TRAP transporter TAXI family solute receptor
MKKRYLIVVWLIVVGVFLCVFSLPATMIAAEKKDIKIAGGRVGDPWYVLSQALANFINKGSDQLRAEVVTTPGLSGCAEVMKDKPKEYIGASCGTVFAHFRMDDFGKARGYYFGMRWIANFSSQTNTMVTYDQNIKTIKDLAGKRVHVGRKGATNTFDMVALLKEWGVLDKVKLVHGGYGGGKSKLMDGLVDATYTLVDHVYPLNFSKGAFITEMETKKPLHYLDLGKEIIEKMRKKGSTSMVPVRLPPKTLDPKTQPNEIWLMDDLSFLAADEKMDNKVVYEVTKIIWETAGKWGTWHPQGAHMTKEFIPAMFVLDRKLVHAGALKFYDDNGIKLKDMAELLR